MYLPPHLLTLRVAIEREGGEGAKALNRHEGMQAKLHVCMQLSSKTLKPCKTPVSNPTEHDCTKRPLGGIGSTQSLARKLHLATYPLSLYNLLLSTIH